MFQRAWFLVFLALAGCVLGGFSQGALSATAVQDRPLVYRIVAEYPHDTRHFTQGLIFLNGKLIESTGLYGASAIYEFDLKSVQTLQRNKLSPEFFGEGLARAGAHLYQLSWREQTGFIYDLSFNLLKSFRYSGEGWGITTLPRQADTRERLVISDGSARLQIMETADLKQIGSILVRDEHGPVGQLNELEFARGVIFANVWMTDRIVAIDPADGRVKGSLDLRGLKDGFEKPKTWNPQAHVLNGIAYDPATDHFFVTGKCWPKLFEIQILDGPSAPQKR